ncbi:MAG: LPS assembly protein LptD, partial [Pseudomonadota bacterium]|nr:LPS assembly protein LptD [Pseudomonadota bacterium]
MHRIKKILTLSTLLGCSATCYANNVSAMLNWQPDPNNICLGNFIDPPAVATHTPTAPIAKSVTTIDTKAPSSFSLTNESKLSGDVRISQPGRLLRANTASIQRDPENKNITTIDLRGNVRYNEMQKELAGEHVTIDLPNEKISLWQGAYRMQRPNLFRPLQAWGTAQYIQQQHKIITIDRATYTTCPLCETPLWQLKAQQLAIDQNQGKAVGHDVTFEVANVPIFYTPYISYSIDRQRKSGFLLPLLAYNHHDGATIMQPYYLNLAPNYDATLMPIEYQLRGFAMNGEFRFLTQHSFGKLIATIIPYDQEFSRYQDLERNLPLTDPSSAPYITLLENSSTTRWHIAGEQSAQFNNNISTSLIANWVSDSYYLQDFGHGPHESNSNTLLNQLNFNYNDDYWRLLARTQVDQTLHPLHDNSTRNQYNRLPQLTAEGDWVTGSNRPRYLLNAEYINFDQQRNFVTRDVVVSGQRANLRPGIALPMENAYAFFTPRLDLDLTYYWLRDIEPGTPEQIARFLPLTTLDTGLFFDRTMQWLGTHYTQTLEPRAYYVFIPNTFQDDLPQFDTFLPTFTYEQLFKPNRYTGIDRINNANELTVALTSRFLDANDGSEKLLLLLATQFYFEDKIVNMGISDPSDSYTNNTVVSPIIAAMNYHYNHYWSSMLNYVWDLESQLTTSANAYIYFRSPNNHLFAIGYDFVHAGDQYIDEPGDDLSRIDVMLATNITEHWSVLGNFNYNLSHNHPQYSML